MNALYVELAKIGYLTPQETFNAFNTGQMPDEESSYQAQVQHKDQKDKGYYAPQIGGKTDSTSPLMGRPSGTKAPKTTNTITPMGANTYGMKAIRDNFARASLLEEEVSKLYRKTNNIRKIKDSDELIISQITKTIIANEEPSKWEESIATYSENPVDKNKDRINQIYEIAAEHGVDFFLASILLASKRE
jgi:hypothetical protein